MYNTWMNDSMVLVGQLFNEDGLFYLVHFCNFSAPKSGSIYKSPPNREAMVIHCIWQV